MTEPDPQESIRRLLGSLGGETPMPPDVVNRLEEALAAESRARDGGAPDATVIPLRRRLPRLAVAAAAVVVLGGTAYGVISEQQTSPSATSTQNGAVAGRAHDQGNEPGSDGTTSNSLQPPGTMPQGPAPAASALSRPGNAANVAEVSSTSFAADAARALRDVRTGASATDAGSPACQQALTRQPRAVPVTYDGRPAYLLTTRDEAQVSAFTCNGTKLNTAPLP